MPQMKTAHKIFLAKLLYAALKCRSLFGKGDRVTVSRYGIHWNLDLKEGIDLFIYLRGRFEPQTAKMLRQLVKPGQVVLDIGANIGAHTLGLAQRVGPQGKVFAFEPTEYAYEKLVANISLNPHLSKQIVAEQIMLGRNNVADFRMEVYSSWTVIGEGYRHPKHRGQLKSTAGAQLRTLDSYLAEKGNPKVSCIKIDVDGNECEVLAGAELMLHRDHPIICIELSPYVLEEKGTSIQELIDIFARHGYRIFKERNGEELPMLADALITLIGDGASINAIVRSV